MLHHELKEKEEELEECSRARGALPFTFACRRYTRGEALGPNEVLMLLGVGEC
jgi:hypothetical protein